MMIIKKSINKADIAQLPKETFKGRIHVIQTEGELLKAMEYLKKYPVVGIDTETRPTFTKGHHNTVALLQVATKDCCFLFRLNRLGLSRPLVDFLEDPAIKKVGLSLRDDFMMLRKRASLEQQGCVDLQDYVNYFGIADKSLQKIYANLFESKISKSQRLTNWEADTLSESQKVYAATDAWACLKIYKLLHNLKKTGEYELLDDEQEPTHEAQQ